MNNEVITIVSGLPRSGTSMMMKMLEAGGMPVLTDHIRAADADNPKGYYEFERVKQIARDQSWLPEARGKAVKIISELLQHLPPDYDYKVIFMRRQIEETLASRRQMLIRRGETANKAGDERLAAQFRRHFVWLDSRLKKQANTSSCKSIMARSSPIWPSKREKSINFCTTGSMWKPCWAWLIRRSIDSGSSGKFCFPNFAGMSVLF